MNEKLEIGIIQRCFPGWEISQMDDNLDMGMKAEKHGICWWAAIMPPLASTPKEVAVVMVSVDRSVTIDKDNPNHNKQFKLADPGLFDKMQKWVHGYTVMYVLELYRTGEMLEEMMEWTKYFPPREFGQIWVDKTARMVQQ